MMNPLESIEFEIVELTRQKVEIERRLVALLNAKTLLEKVYTPLTPIPTIEQFLEAADVGITDAVRGAFRLCAERKMTATQIRDIVASHGFGLEKYRNAMATIHQVISRLVESKEVDGPFPQGNEKVFQWAGRRSTLKDLANANAKPIIKAPMSRRYGAATESLADIVAKQFSERDKEK
jgi:hypothetical protein